MAVILSETKDLIGEILRRPFVAPAPQGMLRGSG